MKVDATQFFCDTSKCRNSFVTTAGTVTSAYLYLVEAGWLVKHWPIGSAWKHYCPDHRDEPATDGARP